MNYESIITDLRTSNHNKLGIISDIRSTINTQVRQVIADVAFRSLKRITDIPYSVHSEVKRYACPADMQGEDIINIRKQVDSENIEWNKTDTIDFFKRIESGLIAVDSSLKRKTLLINSANDEKYATLDALNTYDADGTWVASGDATNIRTDSVNYVEGTGSVRFDLESGATTATLTKTADTAIDLSAYEENGEIYIFEDIANTDITSYTMNIGSDSSNYYSCIVTNTAENLSFALGWNLLKFTFDTKVGTPDMSNTVYYEKIITKPITMDATTDFRMDNLLVLMGNLYQTVYYSKYPWVDTNGVRKENSTLSSDTLDLDSDETEIVMDKLNEKIAQALREQSDQAYSRDEYNVHKRDYELLNPSEAMATTIQYYNIS